MSEHSQYAPATRDDGALIQLHLSASPSTLLPETSASATPATRDDSALIQLHPSTSPSTSSPKTSPSATPATRNDDGALLQLRPPASPSTSSPETSPSATPATRDDDSVLLQLRPPASPSSSFHQIAAFTARDNVAAFTAAALHGFAGDTTHLFQPRRLPDLPHIRNAALRVCLGVPGFLDTPPTTQLRVLEAVVDHVLVSLVPI